MIKYCQKSIFILLSVFFFLFSISSISPVFGKTVEIYYFYGEGCPFCRQMDEVLISLQREFPELKINKLEVWSNRQNQRLLGIFADVYQVKVEGVPIIFIGEAVIQGFDEGRVLQIREKIRLCSNRECISPTEKLKGKIFNEEKNKKPILGKVTLITGILIIFLILVFSFLKKKK